MSQSNRLDELAEKYCERYKFDEAREANKCFPYWPCFDAFKAGYQAATAEKSESLNNPSTVQVMDKFDEKAASEAVPKIWERYEEIVAWREGARWQFEKDKDLLHTAHFAVHANQVQAETIRELKSKLAEAEKEIEELRKPKKTGKFGNYELVHKTLLRQLHISIDSLRAENEKLKETISYLPKVPTEPYEKEIARKLQVARVALEKVKAAKTDEYSKSSDYFHEVNRLALLADEALKEIEGEK